MLCKSVSAHVTHDNSLYVCDSFTYVSGKLTEDCDTVAKWNKKTVNIIIDDDFILIKNEIIEQIKKLNSLQSDITLTYSFQNIKTAGIINNTNDIKLFLAGTNFLLTHKKLHTAGFAAPVTDTKHIIGCNAFVNSNNIDPLKRLSTFLHELGHCLGWAHDFEKSIMYWLLGDITEFTPDDLHTHTMIYDAPNKLRTVTAEFISRGEPVENIEVHLMSEDGAYHVTELVSSPYFEKRGYIEFKNVPVGKYFIRVVIPANSSVRYELTMRKLKKDKKRSPNRHLAVRGKRREDSFIVNKRDRKFKIYMNIF